MPNRIDKLTAETWDWLDRYPAKYQKAIYRGAEAITGAPESLDRVEGSKLTDEPITHPEAKWQFIPYPHTWQNDIDAGMRAGFWVAMGLLVGLGILISVIWRVAR